MTGSGTTVVHDPVDADRAAAAAGLRALAELAYGRRRMIAVIGELRAAPGEELEDHDAIGRLAVRLNVDLLIAVGHGARHVQAAAGLEGSWDGESVIVATPEEAYDRLREELRGDEVVLVTGSTAAGLAPLADRLTGGAR